MSARLKPLLGALITVYVVFFVGVTYFFGPLMASDVPAGPMMPGWMSLAIVSVLLVLFFDWVNGSVGNPVRSGLIVAIGQLLLVDVYYVLNGTRGIAAAGASAVLLIVGWVAVGIVYGKLLGPTGETT
ncbi:MAG: hypothetical protein BMS9Abin29_2083 [Gemmatimonadota bacterium]|nr:MAG: hypothetical protein BMS9Abin29_2083 [Gemmatimonadota bacterium]